MKREKILKKIKKSSWDIVIIGGGATGLGCSVDAASRGYKTLLLEQVDFAKGTSSRSTKLVHGGVRYLQQGDVSLVFEALKERGLMFKNAPHLVTNQSFVIPTYDWWGGPFYTVGLKVYDLMAGKLGLGPSKHLSLEEAIKALPTVEQDGLKGGVIYQDGQFDDSRMAISLAQTCIDYGGTVLNYCKVTKLVKDGELISGVVAVDQESGEEMKIQAKVVINATGVFADEIIQMDEPEKKDMITPSQGIHLILDKEFLPNNYAIMVPHTSDGRVMFAVPWHNHVVVGTTDTLVKNHSLEPVALESEVDFVLETAGQYLVKQPTRKDVLSVFAGLRPLAKPDGEKKATKEISRGHKILISVSGLITIIGGKWTTYRKMAEDTIEKAIMLGGLPERECVTRHLPVHGYRMDIDPYNDPLAPYGLEKEEVIALGEEEDAWSGWLSEKLQILKSQVVWAVQKELARTVEDVLARRTRALFLDARESIRIAPEVAQLMAKELNRDEKWIADQIQVYKAVAKNYYFED
ncbi:glycerol-3-phosphate dehydrogenase/oxidase [Maribellus maritimus]|uniref:glycerol-3-phosphate dehydrogenase/oxidase n=1 Tax=Maribellus maritimus TaxID=2870838 RepID=UPI001EEAEF63|nr:glycerol-3-phosphate dehydrogenase/oxidase [Maribellus maritimus]MCG6186128.1 glycerol-3-phosphate dehydrogenase/oxidase [Maribellus maritimus]